MWKSKKSIIVTLIVAVVVLFSATAGVVLAQDQKGGPGNDIMARVARILGIDQQKLTNAFDQAQAESRAQRLADLVKEGKITQAQADALKAWEAKKPAATADKATVEAWLKSRPDVPMPGPGPHGPPGPPPNMDEMLANLVKDGKITQAQADQLKAWEAKKPADPKADPQKFQEWLKSRPDVPLPAPPPGRGPWGPPPGQPSTK